MTDINTYANNLLIDFLDSVHDQLRKLLHNEYGDDWFREGIERHLNQSALQRTREMLNSPMAIIDMDKTDEELYGVEHLANIILGNWEIFQDKFHKRNRTEVYFGEIAELRHNVSHRRQHHMLQRGELWRFVQNAQLLLGALESPTVTRFESIATTLVQGGSPWGNELAGSLPPATEIVTEFVGREPEIQSLSSWLTQPSDPQFVIWGYGGSGKSALAYQFARAVRDGAPSDLEAVVWLSAKSREFVEGATRERNADFDSVDTFANALWYAIYDTRPTEVQSTRQGILAELSETPSLVIVDDLDSVLEHEDLAHFLLFELPRSRSRFIYTTRQRVPGLRRIDVGGFADHELEKYIRSCARSYDLDADKCLNRTSAIRSVTDGFPLFVDDLLRHAMLNGLESAIGDWSQRRGDAAREYALRRQLDALGEASRRALIGVAVANRPVSSLELANISGFTDDDIQQAIADLLSWRLISRLEVDAEGRPTFSCNRNTHRLVQKTYGQDPAYASYQASFRTLSGSARSPGLRRAVATAISNTRALVLRGDFHGAEELLKSTMTGELSNDSDLWGVLGWVLSRDKTAAPAADARAAFKRSHELGSRKEDTYFHWVGMEREIAESMVNRSKDDELLKQWRAASHVVELGIARCGQTPPLCQIAAYLCTREAKTLEHLNKFTSAQNCYAQGAEWARRALVAPHPSSREVGQSQLYRTLIVALEGAGEPDLTIEALQQWRASVGGDDPDYRREADRLRATSEYRDHSL